MAYITSTQFEALLKKQKERKAKRKIKANELWCHAISRKGLVKKLDSLFSIFARLRAKKLTGGKCELFEVPHNNCGGIECAFHYITRSKYATRWDHRNIAGACFSANMRYEHDQTFISAIMDWFKKKYGISCWDQMVFDSNHTKKWSNSDLEEKYREIKSRVEGMNG